MFRSISLITVVNDSSSCLRCNISECYCRSCQIAKEEIVFTKWNTLAYSCITSYVKGCRIQQFVITKLLDGTIYGQSVLIYPYIQMSKFKLWNICTNRNSNIINNSFLNGRVQYLINSNKKIEYHHQYHFKNCIKFWDSSNQQLSMNI